MLDITIVFTQHKEFGKCSASALYDIIDRIEPQIIFEELSFLHFDESYVQNKLITLETNAIKEYVKNHEVKHIPVDTYALPKNCYLDIDRMYDKIFTSNMINESRALRRLMDYQSEMIHNKGFEFLNSDIQNKYFEEIDILNEKILDTINNEDLFRIQRLEKETIEKREFEIIKNIYRFSSVNLYEIAVMFIGSGHRQSICEMIKRFEIHEKIKLNWKSYNLP